MADDGKAPDAKKWNFAKPTKAIHTPADMPKFKQSQHFFDVMSFIMNINQKIQGRKREPEGGSEKVAMVSDFLISARGWVETIPPIKQAMRFGNKAFRTWHQKLVEEAVGLHERLLGEELKGATEELMVYFSDGFGSAQRIDYGTGHELCFVTWLAALRVLGVFTDADLLAIVFQPVHEYLLLMRTLQTVYWLEPAGSKGVWGLDDYQFLPLLWGAAQLVGGEFDPQSVHNEGVIRDHSDDYLYFGCIKFILSVKHGGRFAEHSPLLNELSQSGSWAKINRDLTKEYDKEVLSKFPVVQHIYFGSILSINRDERGAAMEHAAPSRRGAPAAAPPPAAAPVPAAAVPPPADGQ